MKTPEQWAAERWGKLPCDFPIERFVADIQSDARTGMVPRDERDRLAEQVTKLEGQLKDAKSLLWRLPKKPGVLVLFRDTQAFLSSLENQQ